MIDLIPYFAGLITLLFGLGFLYAIREGKKNKIDNHSILYYYKSLILR